MLNRFLFILLLTYLPTALADGPYVGIGGGYDLLGGKFNTIETGGVTENLMSQGGVIRGVVGYHMNLGIGFPSLWIAAEGEAEWSSNKVKYANVEQLESLGGFGFLVRLGVDVKNVAKPFLLGGWHAGHFKSQAMGDNKKWLNSGRYGVGVDVYLTKEIILRSEWNQTRYQKWEIGSEDITPLDNQVVFSIVYSILG